MDHNRNWDPEGFNISGWIPAYARSVASKSEDLFVVPLPHRYSCVLIRRTHDGQVSVGDFMEVRIRRNREATDIVPTRYLVIDFRVLERPDYIENIVIIQNSVAMKISAVVVQGPGKYDRKDCLILHHSFFGTLYDFDQQIPQCSSGTEVSLRFKCILWPGNKEQIFVVDRFLDFLKIVLNTPSSQSEEPKNPSIGNREYTNSRVAKIPETYEEETDEIEFKSDGISSWVSAIARFVTASGDLFLATFPQRHSCVLSRNIHGNRVTVGDFVEVQMRLSRDTHHRSPLKYQAVNFRPMPRPKGIEYISVNDNMVTIRATADIKRRINYYGRQCYEIYHESLGSIFDTDRCLDKLNVNCEAGMSVTFRFKCLLCPLTKKSSIFIINNVDRVCPNPARGSSSSGSQNEARNDSMRASTSEETNSRSMDSGNDQDSWHMAYIEGAQPDSSLLFVVPPRLGMSCALPGRIHKDRVKLGDFLEIKIKENPRARRDDTQRHDVDDFRIIPVPDSVEDISIRGRLVRIQVTAIVEKATLYNNKPIQLLYHSVFGTIVDIDNILPMVAPGTKVTLKFKCIVSPLKRTDSIFIVVERIKIHAKVNPSMSSTSVDSRISRQESLRRENSVHSLNERSTMKHSESISSPESSAAELGSFQLDKTEEVLTRLEPITQSRTFKEIVAQLIDIDEIRNAIRKHDEQAFIEITNHLFSMSP